jgi:CRISPR-associated endonuclease/helicase Cas3
MWMKALPARLRASLNNALGLSDDEACSIIAYLASLHDLGKAIPGFQGKNSTLAAILSDDLAISPGINTMVKHGLFSAREMPEITKVDGFPLTTDAITASILGRIVGGHHGIFPRSDELANIGPKARGGDTWHRARLQLAAELAILLGIQKPLAVGPVIDPALVPLLAGFVTVADWLGSSDMFPLAGRVAMESYLPRAEVQAADALHHFGWLPTLQPAAPAVFADIFPFQPNVLQSAVAEVVGPLRKPYLLIVEAPMGMGKTEAALFAADHNLTHEISGGMYIGLPTQATTNAMYLRVSDFLKKRNHGGVLNLQLIHGHAGMVRRDDIFSDVPMDNESIEMRLAARQWFQGRKRPLLAPFGVGTIDQALMAVLQTRHWFVRLFGLAGKTVVFDEVHAYDTYMSTILDQLLGWLAALNCSVILLSATLPSRRRSELVYSYSGTQVESLDAQYPRLTLAIRESDASTRISVTEVPRDEIVSNDVAFVVLSTDIKALVIRLADDLVDGGCAAIICNTVNRAQEVYRELRKSALPDTDYLLFHARMPFGMREEREKRVLTRFGKELAGKNERYARRAVLVATQVVEQSLDLDFDWMASEIAPVDLLLQRMGRLHRHSANDALGRPPRLKAPTLLLLCDTDLAAPPPETFGDSEYVYARYILLRTWLALRGVTSVTVPDDIDELIKQVYEGESLAQDTVWAEALRESSEQLRNEEGKARGKAESILIKSPRPPRLLLRDFNADLSDDDDPSIHIAIRAATRDGRPSVTVVCLHDENGAWRPWGSDLSITANLIPDHDTTQRLLRAAVPISQPAIFRALCTEPCPPKWRSNAHLRHTRAVLFHDGVAEVGSYRLTLDDALGVIIARKEDVDDVELQPD